jgi:hypothetical protein
MGSRAVTCTATLVGEGGEYYFIVPVDIQAAFGRHRPPVRVTIRGHTFRTTSARYGSDYYLVLNKANREATGLERGERARLRIELDTEPRVVDPPEDLARSLAGAPDAKALYERLSFSHQKAYADWVAEAKRPETRLRRADESVRRLLAGRKEPNA